MLPAKATRAFALLHRWVADTHSVKFYGFLLIYGSVMPLPNDVIVVPLGAAGVPYWRVMLPLAAGNIIFNTATALLAARMALGLHRLDTGRHVALAILCVDGASGGYSAAGAHS